MAPIFMPGTESGQASKGAASRRQSQRISPARKTAFEILRRVEEEGAYASVLLATRTDDLSARDSALAHELTLGVLRRQLTLDHLIAHFSNRDPSRLDPPVRIALRLALYQIRFLSRIPPAAAVNDSVSLVRFARIRSAEKFVNAVLRRTVREPKYDPLTGIDDPLERLAVETSHPQWLIARWAEAFGLNEATEFAQANNTGAPVSFRINPKTNREELLGKLRSAGADLIESKLVPDAWRIIGAARMLRHFAIEGKIYIQDEASQLVAHAVNVGNEHRVLDICAGPGGKTTHIATLAGDNTAVIAGEINEQRLRLVIAASRLQKLAGVAAVRLDGRILPFPDASFDRVLVDAPCSGTGTLRRNPEIRWRISAGDIENLSALQRYLLFEAARVVKPNGRLVYSTCSVEPAENEEVVAAFLESNDSFVVAEQPAEHARPTSSGAIRTWPHRDQTDGFFICAFARLPASQ